MKQYVQEAGVRPWHGNELVDLQGENMDSIVAFLKKFGAFIVDGVDVSGSGPYSFSDGLVFMEHPTDGWKMARFAGDVSTSGYGLLYLDKTVTQKLYNDGNNHDAVYEYTALFLDDGDVGYAALDASLTDDQKIYLGFDFAYKQEFDQAFKSYAVPAFSTEAAAILSATQLTAATVQTRVCRATGQVHIKGSVTVTNSNTFGLPGQWLPVKALSTLFGQISAPAQPVYFTGVVRYGYPYYNLEQTGLDYIDVIGLSIDNDGKLYIGAKRPQSPTGSYTVYFETAYSY